MTSGPGGDGAHVRADRPTEADLRALRARLYGPDVTQADRDAYEESLIRSRSVLPEEAGALPSTGQPTAVGAATGPPPVPARLLRPLVIGAVAVALLAIGAGIGSAARPTAARPATSVSTTATPPASWRAEAHVLPRPVAAAALPRSAAERTRQAAALRSALASYDASATDDVAAIDGALDAAEVDPARTATWMQRKGCSQSTGTSHVSRQGRPSIVDGATFFQLPAGAHLRITVVMTRAADWSWLLYGTRGADRSTVPVSIGAGSVAEGAAQVAEFDTRSAVQVTGVSVFTSERTPFFWRLESCTTG